MAFSPKNIFIHDVLDSTNEWLKDNASKMVDKSACLAKQQTAGRGRSGNEWVSKTGNYYGSFFLRPQNMTLKEAGLVSFVTSLALYDVLSKFLEGRAEIGLKWPNDVFVEGKKISGILLESETDPKNLIDYLIVGVGVNLSHAPNIDTATALSDYMTPPTPEEFLSFFSTAFEARYDDFCVHGFEPIRQTWLDHALFKGEKIRIRLPKETFYGVFEDIDTNGHLLARMDDGTLKRVASGDVFF